MFLDSGFVVGASVCGLRVGVHVVASLSLWVLHLRGAGKRCQICSQYDPVLIPLLATLLSLTTLHAPLHEFRFGLGVMVDEARYCITVEDYISGILIDSIRRCHSVV